LINFSKTTLFFKTLRQTPGVDQNYTTTHSP